jgi:hypothetical protein
VRGFESIAVLHVVADPGAIDGATWTTAYDTAAPVLRIAPDEAFSPGSTAVVLDDEHAIIVEEHGYVVRQCQLAEIAAHLDWPVPLERPCFVQGAVAGVPAKVWILHDTFVLVYTAAAYAHELADRLGWLP